MKKKFISIILAALMIVPFGMLSVSADTTVPAEPKVTVTNKYYIAYDGTGDGLSADKPMSSKATADENSAWGEQKIPALIKAGGTIVIVGKGHAGANITLATDTPICITGVDGETSYISKNAEGTFDTTNNPGQKGMFMTDGKTITFAGDVIFDNTVLLGRRTTADTYSVAGTGKLVINDTVSIVAGTEGNPTPKLNVEEGGYAYLHAVGFSAYTGKGTLVIDEALKSQVESLLANYEGNVVYVKAEADTTDNAATTDKTTTTESNTTTTAPTDNPSTGDMTVGFAAIAALSVAACISVVIVKKAKEN